MLTGREIHHRVTAPADRPHQFFDLFVDARTECRVADIGINLDQKIAANNHRLQFRVIDIGGNNRPPGSDFATHKFRRYAICKTRTHTVALETRDALGGIKFIGQ